MQEEYKPPGVKTKTETPPQSESGYGYGFSYHQSEEEFDRYLGNTSYYLSLQKNISKLIKFISSEGKILELGFRTGRTAVKIANDNQKSKVVALCENEQVLEGAKAIAKKKALYNNMDFCEDKIDSFVARKEELREYDILYMLYSFHHIPDNEYGKHANKVMFLRNCFQNMKLNSFLCIADLFLLDNNNSFDKLFIDNRVNEGKASTFWNSLMGITKKEILAANEMANQCENKENHILELKVNDRDQEYLVTLEWLKKQAEKAGFTTVINKNVNVVGDAIILFKKDKEEGE
jgi:hypothetical protein